jgi:hypothetical protein
MGESPAYPGLFFKLKMMIFLTDLISETNDFPAWADYILITIVSGLILLLIAVIGWIIRVLVDYWRNDRAEMRIRMDKLEEEQAKIREAYGDKIDELKTLITSNYIDIQRSINALKLQIKITPKGQKTNN